MNKYFYFFQNGDKLQCRAYKAATRCVYAPITVKENIHVQECVSRRCLGHNLTYDEDLS